MRWAARTLLARVASAAVEVMYPKVCAGCGMRGHWLCDVCEPSVPAFSRDVCSRCGSPESDHGYCRPLAHDVASTRAAYPYTGWVAESIRRFKYGLESSRAVDLAARMLPVAQECGRIDLIVPVPLHPKKVNARGFNQSALLATRIGAALDVPVAPVLVRTRATAPQVRLDGGERRANVAGAFGLDPSWLIAPGAHVVLIDDVRTTGATTDACASALHTSGATRRVSVITFAQELSDAELSRWRSSLSARSPSPPERQPLAVPIHRPRQSSPDP